MLNTKIWKAYYLMYINRTLNCNDLVRGFSHYMTSGRHNGNLLFDWKFYVQRNALPYRSLETALAHYLKTGILKNFVTHNLKSLEEVVASFFDWKYYVHTHSLSICNREGAIEHWNCKGKALGYTYNSYMGTLPKDETTVNTTKYITDREDNIIIRHDNTVTIKNVQYAITNVLRNTYSSLLQRLLLLKIELIRLSSDRSFRSLTRRQTVQINTYINEIEHIIKTTRYGEKPLLIKNTNDEGKSISLVSDNSHISVHPNSEYNYNRTMDFTLYVRETPTFKALEAGERAIYNSTWIELKERINRNNTLVHDLGDEIALYKTYIEDTLQKLEKRLELINTVFTNMKELLPGNNDLEGLLQRQYDSIKDFWEIYQKRHEEFMEILRTDKNAQCFTSLGNTLEISTLPLNKIIVEVNDLNNTSTTGLITNGIIFSIDNLEKTLDLYRDSNSETVENIHKNKNLVKETRDTITNLLQNYTNNDLSATIITENLRKLQEWKIALESDLNNSTALQSKNSTIQNIINLLFNIRIKKSVSDEIVTEHLRRNTRERNIDEITDSIKIAIEKLKEQKDVIEEISPLLEKIRSQSDIILHDTIFNKNFFTWECLIESLDRVENCSSDRNLGRHVLRLPYGIAIDIKKFNPIAWGINRPILIRATKPKWRSIDIYCSDRLQYSINIDNMNLNITDNTIKLNTFEDIQNSIRNVDCAVEQLITNLKYLRNSYARI